MTSTSEECETPFFSHRWRHVQCSSILAGNSLHTCTIDERRAEFHLFFQACRQCSWSYLNFSENMQPCSLHAPITHTCRQFRKNCLKLDSNPPRQSTAQSIETKQGTLPPSHHGRIRTYEYIQIRHHFNCMPTYQVTLPLSRARSLEYSKPIASD